MKQLRRFRLIVGLAALTMAAGCTAQHKEEMPGPGSGTQPPVPSAPAPDRDPLPPSNQAPRPRPRPSRAGSATIPQAVSPRAERMACSPTRLNPTDLLRISLPSGHGGDFAIISPAGAYYVIAFDQPDPGSPVQPVISSAVFKGQSAVVSPVSALKGINWSAKAQRPERIFTRSGRYRVVVSNALETEDPILDGWCEVNYVAKGR